MSRSRFAPRLVYLAGVGVLAALFCAGLFRAQLPLFDRELIGTHNDVIYHFGILSWQWRLLSAFDLTRLLDAPVMAPLVHGHAFGDNLLLLSLLGLPVAATGHEVLAYNLVLVATFVLTAVCGAAFGNALSGSRLVGVFVALACAFFPLRLTTLFHLNNLALFCCPLTFWALVRWHQRRLRRHAVFGTLAAYGQFLCSIQLFIFLALFAALWLLALWARARFVLRARELAHGAGVVLLALALFAPWVPGYWGARQYATTTRSTDEMAVYRATLGDWIGRLSPGVLVTVLLGVALVLWALRARAPRDPVPLPGAAHLGILLALVLVGVTFSLGPAAYYGHGPVRLPFYWWMQAVPLFDNIRVPQRIQRLVVVLAAGAAGIALHWLLLHARRLWEARPRSLRPAPARLPEGLALAVVVGAAWWQAPPAPEATRPLPQPAYAAAVASLPEAAVVLPVPLELNWPERPPMDLVAIASQRRFVGGYDNVIPDVFWPLARRLASLPDAGAQGAARATGATLLLVHDAVLGARQREALASLATTGARLNWRDAGWQLWQLDGAAAPWFSPFDDKVRFELCGPAVAAPGQALTLGLSPEVPHARLDPVVERQVGVELADADGRLVAVHAAPLWSPMLVEADGAPYRTRLPLPEQPGRYLVRVRWPRGPGGADPIALQHPVEVRAGLETSHDAKAGRATATLLARPAVIYRGAAVRFRLRLVNEDEVVWLATSGDVLPANAGQMVWGAVWQGPTRRQEVQRPFEHFVALPHDVAPHESVEVAVDLVAPVVPGIYTLVLRLGAYQVARIMDAPPLTLAEALVVE